VTAQFPGTPEAGDGPDAEPRRFVVCGDNPLALRLVDELVTRYAADVTVVLPSAQTGYGPRLAALPGVEVVECERPSTEAFLRAEVGAADALALVNQDDGGNLDAALLARELNPHLRIVVRMFNASLGAGIRRLLGDCEVLSESAIAAPAFVAAALGDDAPAFLRLPGPPLFVGRRAAVPAPNVLCGIAVEEGHDAVELLPADQERADLVIAASEVPAPGPVRRHPRHPLRAVTLLIGRRLRLILAVLAGLIVAGTVVLMAAKRLNWWQAAYQTVLTALGNGNGDPDAKVPEQVVTLLLTVVSVALIPVLTAAVVEAAVNARLRLAAGGLSEPIEGHVVVVGLGNVGTRVIRALTDLGVDVVAVDRDGLARGVPVARELHLPFVLGDATQEQTLQAASVATCRALVVTSTDDVNNLETALLGRAIQPDVRIVLRLFDGDFAERVQRNFHINASRSVSYLAAPAFAAAMTGREVVDVIPVRRRVLLVAELPVEAGSPAEGLYVSDLNRPHATRILGIRTGRGTQTLWSPPGGRKLMRTDRLVVLATRTGLGLLLAATGTADPTG
jgi:Trk K+ transport system NAD-binding subunit